MSWGAESIATKTGNALRQCMLVESLLCAETFLDMDTALSKTVTWPHGPYPLLKWESPWVAIAYTREELHQPKCVEWNKRTGGAKTGGFISSEGQGRAWGCWHIHRALKEVRNLSWEAISRKLPRQRENLPKGPWGRDVWEKQVNSEISLSWRDWVRREPKATECSFKK